MLQVASCNGANQSRRELSTVGCLRYFCGFVENKKAKGNADAYGPCASLFARMSQPIRNPHSCSAFRPIPVGISRSLEAQFNSPLNPLRFTHSHSLVVHTCYICTSATMMSGCRKHASTALMEDFFRLQKDQEKTDFPTGAYAKITRRLLMPASRTCNLLPLAPEPLLYFACLSYIFVTDSRSRSTPVVLTSNRQHGCLAELGTWCSSNKWSRSNSLSLFSTSRHTNTPVQVAKSLKRGRACIKDFTSLV